MAYPLTITASAMRDINRSAILEIIRRESPVSRTAIAERLGVSLPTVMRIVDELVDEGFVCLHGSTEFTGGRRRPLLEFDTENNLILGFDLGGAKMYGAISNFGGKILDQANINQHGTTSEESFSLLIGLIQKLLASPYLNGRRVRGIGVGAPGVTLHHEGIVKWAYTLHWEDFPLKARLSEKFDLPIIVDNDVNLAALGELWFGAGQGVQNMVLIAIGTGIGSGIIIDGVLYRGANESSGEIGHMITGREYLGNRYTDFGVLETMASGTAMVELARSAIAAGKTAFATSSILPEDIFESARNHEAWALEIIENITDYLAIAVANMVVSFDPELIVLGGGVTKSADQLVPPILKKINSTIPALPNLVVSQLGLQATVMGVITNVLHNTSNCYIVRKLS